MFPATGDLRSTARRSTGYGEAPFTATGGLRECFCFCFLLLFFVRAPRMRDARKNNKYKKHLSPEDFSLPISCSKLPFQCVVFWVLGRSASRPTLTSRNSPVAIQEEKSGTIPNTPKGFLESFRAFFVLQFLVLPRPRGGRKRIPRPILFKLGGFSARSVLWGSVSCRFSVSESGTHTKNSFVKKATPYQKEFPDTPHIFWLWYGSWGAW